MSDSFDPKDYIARQLHGSIFISGFFFFGLYLKAKQGFPSSSAVKNLPANAEDAGHFLVRKTPWSRKRKPTLIFLPGEPHGQKSVVGYSPWGHKRVRHILATKQQQ